MADQQTPNQVLPQSPWNQNPYNYVSPNAYTQYGILPPAQQTPNALLGQAGYVGSPMGAAVGGFQAGENLAQQVRGDARANREYNETRQAQRESQKGLASQTVNAREPDPSDPQYATVHQQHIDAQQKLNQLNQPQGFAGFLHALGTAVSHLGHGGAPNQGSAIPAPVAAQVAAPAPAASPQPQGTYAQGGPVGTTPDFMSHPALGQVISAGTEGQQPPSVAAGGGYRGFADGGPVPGIGTNLPQGQAPAQAMGPPDPAAGALPAAAQDPSGPFNRFYQGLLNASLNDKGEPQGREAVPSPTANPNVPQQSAANNPAAQKGIPEDSPEESGKAAHSLSAGWYDAQDNYARAAAMHASAAGHDPGAVYNAMSNMTTSFLQTHIMREAGAAAVAMQAGNMPAVEKALKNMYYYVPDGQELKTQKIGGQLVYQNPIYPYIDPKTNQPTDIGGPGATPNMVPVDAQHISMLGQAALNPLAISHLIMDARMGYAKMSAERMTAEGMLMRGRGIAASGIGAEERAQASLKEVASTNLLKASEAQWYATRSAASRYAMSTLQGMRLDPVAQKGIEDTQKAVDDMVMGPPTVVTDPMAGAGLGKPTRDT